MIMSRMMEGSDIDLMIHESAMCGCETSWEACEEYEWQDAAQANVDAVVLLLINPLNGRIMKANGAAMDFYGYSKKELLNMTIYDINLLSREDTQELLCRAAGGRQKHFTLQHRSKGGGIKNVDVYYDSIFYDNKKALLSVIFDVTEREKIKRQNEFLAYHDYLTGLYNRRFFNEEFIRRYNNADSEFPISIILGDVNGFKLFNDTFGHLAGDKALIDIAYKIRQSINKEDIFARLDGDEFAIIISKANEADVRKYLDKIEELNKYTGDDGNRLPTIALGYGIQKKKDDILDDLIKEAEAYMFSRKCYSSCSTRSNTVNAIMNTLFAKSEREKNHSERVGLLCAAIAQQLQWGELLINRIRVAGFLHDIGKIGVEESILNKNGKLNEHEWEIMKLHPAKSAYILERTVEFGEIANIVLSHHERYDGTGYPNGLKGREIPIEARIIAVADAYDAMTNERPYRKAMSEDTAVDELITCSGYQFDPEIVEIFIKKTLPHMRTSER